MEGEALREGLFSLHTRRFGTVAELVVQRLAGLGERHKQFHDLFDDARRLRVEVKFARVLKAHDEPITIENVLTVIEQAKSADRLVAFGDVEETAFDCNIQQVKPAEFDVLYYGLCFSDVVVIFRIESQAIAEAGIGYSDKQHKGNVGEGQFHISAENLNTHLERFLYRTLTYEELGELLSVSPRDGPELR
jgi:hypothetical protein